MSFEKKTWNNRVSEYPTRRNLVKADGTSEIVTVERNEGSVSNEGDAFSAENMNDFEERVAKGFEETLTRLDIVNNLTTASTTEPLSANQGKVLKEKVDAINVYVGSDKKLHFVDSEGADSVLPFNNYRKYVTYRTYENSNANSSIAICVYHDVCEKLLNYKEGSYTDIVGLATLSYSMPNWSLTFLKDVTVNGTTYKAGDIISWTYDTSVEYEVVLIE